MTRTGVHQDKSTTTVFLCVENKAKTLGLRVSLEEILLPHPTFNPLFLSPLGIVGSSWTCLYSHPGTVNPWVPFLGICSSPWSFS